MLFVLWPSFNCSWVYAWLVTSQAKKKPGRPDHPTSMYSACTSHALSKVHPFYIQKPRLHFAHLGQREQTRACCRRRGRASQSESLEKNLARFKQRDLSVIKGRPAAGGAGRVASAAASAPPPAASSDAAMAAGPWLPSSADRSQPAAAAAFSAAAAACCMRATYGCASMSRLALPGKAEHPDQQASCSRNSRIEPANRDTDNDMFESSVPFLCSQHGVSTAAAPSASRHGVPAVCRLQFQKPADFSL